MIIPLKVTSNGYLIQTSPLSVSVEGYLTIGVIPPPPPPPPPPHDNQSGDGVSKKDLKKKRRIEREDEEEIQQIIQSFLLCLD